MGRACLASPGDGAGHVPAALDRDERRGRDRSDHGRTDAPQPFAGRRELEALAQQQGPFARHDPEPLDHRDRRPRRHHPWTVCARHERHAIVRARRGHHRPRPDLVVRVIADSRDHPVVPANGRDAGHDPDSGRRGAFREFCCRPARDVVSGIDPPRAADRTLRLDDHDRLATGPGVECRPQAGPAATDDQDIRLESSRHAPTGRGARRPGTAHPQPPAPAEPAQDVEIPLAKRLRSQELVVVERRWDPARPEADQGQQVPRDVRQRVFAARDQPLADRAPGTTGRSAGRPPRTRTNRTGRSST